MNGGVKKCGRQAEEDEAVDRLDRAEEPPAICEKDGGVTVAGDRAERIEYRVPPVGQGAEPEIETPPRLPLRARDKPCRRAPRARQTR